MPEFIVLGLAIGIVVALLLIFFRSAQGVILPVLLFLGVAGLALVVNLREEQRKDFQAEARNNALDTGRNAERSRAYLPQPAAGPQAAAQPAYVPAPQPPSAQYSTPQYPAPQPQYQPRGAAAGITANQTSYVNPTR